MEPKRLQLSRNELQAATSAADAARGLIVKALLHRDDPRGYPVARDPKSLERRAVDRLEGLASSALAEAQKGLKDAERLRRARGRYSDADLRRELNRTPRRVSPVALSRASESLGPGPHIELRLHSVRCRIESDIVGQDHTVLGGLQLGASGGVAPLLCMDCGRFSDGDRTVYDGRRLGVYRLSATPSYPKTLHGLLVLATIRTDGGAEAWVQYGPSILLALAETILDVDGSESLAGRAEALRLGVDALIGIFFPQYFLLSKVLPLTLTREQEFGGPDSPLQSVLATGNGTYDISCYWRLTA